MKWNILNTYEKSNLNENLKVTALMEITTYQNNSHKKLNQQNLCKEKLKHVKAEKYCEPSQLVVLTQHFWIAAILAISNLIKMTAWSHA